MIRTIKALLVILLAATAAFLALPLFLDAFILPRLLNNLFLPGQQASIHRLTPFSLSGSLRLQEQYAPVLSLPRFQLRFSPLQLAGKRTASLTLDHAVLHLRRHDGRVNLQLPLRLSRQPGKEGENPLPPFPLAVDSIILEQCSLIIHEPQLPDIRITVTARLFPHLERTDGSFQLEGLDGTFSLSDALTGGGSFSLERGPLQNRLSLTLGQLALVLPERFLPQALHHSLAGEMSLRLAADLDPATLAIETVRLNGTLQQLSYSSRQVSLVGGGENKSVDFSLAGTRSQFAFAAGPVAAVAPLGARLQATGIGSFENGRLSSEGALEAAIAAGSKPDHPPLPLVLNYSGNWAPNDSFSASITGEFEPGRSFSALAGRLNVEFPEASLSFHLRGQSDQLEARLTLAAPSLSARFDETAAHGSELTLTSFLASGPELARVELSAALGRFSLPARSLALTDLHAALPLTLPAAPETGAAGPGSISIGSIAYDTEAIAELTASIRQNRHVLEVDGALSPVSIDTALSFSGEVAPLAKRFDLGFELPPTRIDELSIQQLLKDAGSLNFEAQVRAAGKLSLNRNKITGTAQLSLTDGTLQDEARNLRLTDIDCALELDRLPALISRPSQRCTIGSIDLGKLHFAGTSVQYRLEDGKTVFVEQGSTDWCQGTLDTASMRFRLDDQAIDTVFYASRINLADLLSQFGLDQTEGKGALNGKLPIILTKTGIVFDDGFLYSTPGTGGLIRFTNTDLLRQGIGQVQQAGQLTYSLQALEDFAYNWTKVAFNSDGEDLLMNLELDGAPRTPLAFTVKNGMIVESNEGNGLQYPIRLDINFRLPLTDMFHVGRNIKSIMGNN